MISYKKINILENDVILTLIHRISGLGFGVVTVLIISFFLPQTLQGFYYTFGSVIALNIFFELGLTYVVLQFASHEKSHLEWTSFGTLTGSEVAQTRLAAMLKVAVAVFTSQMVNPRVSTSVTTPPVPSASVA